MLGLTRYLEELATANVNFNDVDFREWMDAVSGKRALVKSDLSSFKKS